MRQFKHIPKRWGRIRGSRQPNRLTIVGVVVVLVAALAIQIFAPNHAAAAITVRGASSANNGGGATTLSVTTPAGVLSGDILVITLAARMSSPQTIQGPGGTLALSDSDATSNLYVQTYIITLTSAPLATYDFQFYDPFSCSPTCSSPPVSVKAVAGIVAYTGVSSVGGATIATASQLNASNTSAPSATVTSSNSGDRLVVIWGSAIGTTMTTPASMTAQYNNTNTTGSASSKATVYAFDQSLSTVGSYNPSTTLGAAAVNYPDSIILRSTATQYNQSSYRWFQNTNVGTYQHNSEYISSNVDAAYATTSDGTYFYTAGYEGNGANDWRIEKRDLNDGQLISAFGSSGVVSEAPSANDDRAQSIATDGTYIYIAGYDSSPSSTNQEFRLEKRNATTGNLCSSVSNCAAGAFNTTGIITSNPSTGADTATAVALDANYVYITGTDKTPGNNEFRIEKYNNATGNICSSGTNCAAGTFGTAGVVTSNPSANDDTAQAATLDSSYIYIGGYDSSVSTTDTEWHIEKYNNATGNICSSGTNCAAGTFGTAGVVKSNPSSFLEGVSPGQDAMKADANYLYITGTQNASPQNLRWRLEKYNNATGNICSSGTNCTAGTFGTAGAVTVDPSSTADDTPTALAIDGSNIYWGGNDRSFNSGFSAWRVEKRDIATANLATAFGTSGVYTYNPGINHDEIRSMFLDGGALYVAGYFYTNSTENYDWAYGKINTVDARSVGPAQTPLFAQNTAATGITSGQAFRLRMLLGISTALTQQNGTQVKLQFAQRGVDNSCDTSFSGETYADVTASTAIAYNANSDIANLAWPSSGDPTDSTNPVLAQGYVGSSGTTATNNATDILVSNDGEWDFSLTNLSATQGTSYCLRLVDFTSGNALDTYSNIPELAIQPTSTAPAAPTLSLPTNGSATVSSSPVFNLKTTDAESSYLQYKIVLYQSNCSTIVNTFDQSASQYNWTGQDVNSGTAYVGSSTIGSSTLAIFTYPGFLTPGTTYCWKAAAIDPGDTNTFGSYSATNTFTVTNSTQPVQVNGGLKVGGGTRFGN